MTGIRFLDFAALCKVVYEMSATRATGGFVRHGRVDRRITGFQGAVFQRATGTGFDWVVAVAGTQTDDEGGIDVVTDAGFGGGRGRAIGTGITMGIPLVGLPLAGIINMACLAGEGLLSAHCHAAQQMVEDTRSRMGRNDRLFITGHSLGGGIAQIVSARTGVSAVGISAPAVTAVDGVAADWARTRSPIVCLRVRNDPINQTGLLGDLLGRVVVLDSPRTGGAAHSIDQTLVELSSHGQFCDLGARDPFASQGGGASGSW